MTELIFLKFFCLKLFHGKMKKEIFRFLGCETIRSYAS